MKIKVIETTIEADVNELASSNSMAESLSNALRRVFNQVNPTTVEEEEEDGTE